MTERADELREIHVSSLLGAALLAQAMSSGPGDVVLEEAIAILIAAKKGGYGLGPTGFTINMRSSGR